MAAAFGHGVASTQLTFRTVKIRYFHNCIYVKLCTDCIYIYVIFHKSMHVCFYITGAYLPLGTVGTCLHIFSLKMPQNAAAAIHICVMYRPDQPALSAQTDPADTFRLRGIDIVVIPETENPQEAKSVHPCTPVWHA